jgi:hypothetical protein
MTVFLFVSCKPTPPVDYALINEETYEFENNQTSLVAIVPEYVNYNVPIQNNDCYLGTKTAQKNWQVINDRDYVEVTIHFPEGVLPGWGNARSFGLRNILSNGKSTIKPAPLTIESGPSNSVKVYSAAWRFYLNGNENISGEVIENGSSNYNKPFERKIENTPLGQKWEIIVPSNVKTNGVFASIRYHLHMGNVKICP